MPNDDGRSKLSLFTRLTSSTRPNRGRMGLVIAAVVIIGMLIGGLVLLPFI